MLQHRLTSIDNPFDPFSQYDEWKDFDSRLGYYSEELVARVLVTSDEFPDSRQQSDYEEAIDTVLEYDVLKVFKKVSKQVEIQVVD